MPAFLQNMLNSTLPSIPWGIKSKSGLQKGETTARSAIFGISTEKRKGIGKHAF